MAHIVQLRTMTPTICTVSVEAESYEEAVKKIKKDLQNPTVLRNLMPEAWMSRGYEFEPPTE